MKQDEIKLFERAIEEIAEVARGFGLDFYPMRFEIVPADVLYTFGAYGMPTRYSHWSFGKAFHRMKMDYDLNLSRIYELVINNDPCYAFFLEGNSLIQNKMIAAHVIAHCDFFKNNIRFSQTNRQMVESMAVSAERIRQYEMEYGSQEVEKILDAAMSIQEHIDPSLVKPPRRPPEEKTRSRGERPKPRTPYDDLWKLDGTPETPREERRRRFPEQPQKDLLLFILEHSHELSEWQRDILTIVRNEMLYFWPQIETKIMNEGWATYWHLRIMRELDLTEEETIEFAKLHSLVVQPSRHTINPYYLGVKIFEDIEKRWNEPTEEEQKRYGRKPGKGREKIFEVREIDSDISFLRNYLTKELVEELDLYIYQKVGNDWMIVEKDWEKVRDQMVAAKVNGGFPYIVVEDGDYLKNGELYLKHQYEGIELDLKYVERTLPYVYTLWGRTIHLETVVEERPVLFTYDGKRGHRRFL
ncbi:MAG: stage V sporulation protein R [Bacillus thermozeamaize]|uniref:Stage V sporulation protein R n=1 Tax=Bacillus thermozeamaize TaxID=230954 RepID=A0A1Y3PGC2_9BACI|nr:MAG: stage V sporulation protein R [Bacillus thermozeamaize]